MDYLSFILEKDQAVFQAQEMTCCVRPWRGLMLDN